MSDSKRREKQSERERAQISNKRAADERRRKQMRGQQEEQVEETVEEFDQILDPSARRSMQRWISRNDD